MLKCKDKKVVGGLRYKAVVGGKSLFYLVLSRILINYLGFSSSVFYSSSCRFCAVVEIYPFVFFPFFLQ